jgi:hypothetical protein
VGIDINDSIIDLPVAEYVTINQEESVPADDLSVTFPYIEQLPELVKIKAFYNSELVFLGIVDEQQVVAQESGVYTKIIARSVAGVLIDNESKPVSYLNPSTSVIWARHLEPHGIDKPVGDDVVLKGALNISKGMTDWQAFYNFCINAYGTVPRVEGDGTVKFSGVECDREMLFSNNGGTKYTSIKENNKRYQLLSTIKVKTTDSGGYNSIVENKDAVSRKIDRQRYLDSASTSNSLVVADTMLENAKKESYEITLICTEPLINVLGAKTKVQDDYIGEIDNLYISGICYRLKPEGEYTTVTLKKKGE